MHYSCSCTFTPYQTCTAGFNLDSILNSIRFILLILNPERVAFITMTKESEIESEIDSDNESNIQNNIDSQSNNSSPLEYEYYNYVKEPLEKIVYMIGVV